MYNAVHTSELCQLQHLPSKVRAAIAGKVEGDGRGGWKEVVVKGRFRCKCLVTVLFTSIY